jgi:hypothetical protein
MLPDTTGRWQVSEGLLRFRRWGYFRKDCPAFGSLEDDDDVLKGVRGLADATDLNCGELISFL